MNKPTMEIGRSGVCSGKVVLVAHDPATDLRVGKCCMEALSYAHRQINLAMAEIPKLGLRHPMPGEFTEANNH